MAAALAVRHETTAIPPAFRRAVNESAVAFALAGIDFAEAYSVALRPSFSTAAWCYLPPHRIWLGEQMLANASRQLRLEAMVRYAAAFVRHEYSHMRWTTRAMRHFGQVLAAEGIPQSLWNLFEDARIEHLCREALGQRFDWLEFEQASCPETPSGLLFALIQHDGELPAPHLVPQERQPEHEAVWAAFGEVQQFYREIIACAQTEDLLPVLRRWLRRFPQERREPERGEGLGGRGRGAPEGEQVDATMGMLAAAELAELVEQLDEGAVEITRPLQTGGTQPEAVEVESVGNAELLAAAAAGGVDGARADKVADALAKILVRPAGWVSREEPSKLVDIRSVLSAATSGWRFRVREIPRRRRYDLTLVFDCSGSMSGLPLIEGRILVAALSRLAQQRLLSGYLVLSAVMGRHSLWQRFRLPVAVSLIERIHAFGSAEGLQQALLANAQECADADQVFVYTDASICDTPLHRPLLARKRIRPIGLYVGDPQHAAEMPRHFAEYLVRPTIEALAEAMVARFKVRGR